MIYLLFQNFLYSWHYLLNDPGNFASGTSIESVHVWRNKENDIMYVQRRVFWTLVARDIIHELQLG